MNKLLRISLGLLLAVLFVGQSSSAFADESEDVPVHYDSMVAPEAITPKQIQSILIESLVRRTWEIKSKSDTKVVAFIKRRGMDTEVTFVIDGNSIEILAWGYRTDRNGIRKNPEIPVRWLANLRKDINTRFYIAR